MARVLKSSEYKIVNRIVNGKEFQSTRPASYRKTKNPTGRRHYAKFGISVHLAKLLSNLKVLYECWQTAKLDGTRAYNRIISYNYERMTPEGPTDAAAITPPGFNPPFQEFSCLNGIIKITFGDAFKINPDTDYIAIIMIVFDPKEKTKIPYQILRIYYNRLSPDKNISFDLNCFRDIKRYNKFIIYSAVMRKKPKKISWSSTHTISGEL